MSEQIRIDDIIIPNENTMSGQTTTNMSSPDKKMTVATLASTNKQGSSEYECEIDNSDLDSSPLLRGSNNDDED